MEDYSNYNHLQLVEILNERDASLLDLGQESSHNRKLIHHLKLHQTELEVQNRQLQEAQQALEISREHYSNMFDISPVGMIVLDKNATVLEINLTALKMINQQQRKSVKGMPISGYFGQRRVSSILNFLRHVAASGVTEKFNFTFKGEKNLQYFCFQCLFDQENDNFKCVLTETSDYFPEPNKGSNKKQNKEHRENAQALRIENERLDVLHATMRTVADIVNNTLNSFLYIKTKIEHGEEVPIETLEQIEKKIHQTAGKLSILGDMKSTPEKESSHGSVIDFE